MSRALFRSMLLLGGLLFAGCPQPPETVPDAGKPPSGEDAGEDAGQQVTGPSCDELCLDFGLGCDGMVDGPRCATACGLPDLGAPLQACLREARDCAAGKACTDAYRPPPSVPFSAGPYGVAPRDVAGPFTLQTTAGPWSFEDEWTGDDHYVFIVHYLQSAYTNTLLEGSVAGLLEASPRNVHYFFLRAEPSAAFDAFVERARIDVQLLPVEDALHWMGRVHFGDEDITAAPGWLGELVRSRLASTPMYKFYENFQWAIDRTQRVREVGMLGVLTQSGTALDLRYLAYEPKHFEFEYAREQRLGQQAATVITLVEDEVLTDWEGPANWRDAVVYPEVTLPDADTMATFDTLEVDLEMECLNHRDGDCGAWDYLASLYLCRDVGTGGSDGGVDLDGGVEDAGMETFRDPRPGCDVEIARWITTYWREGRWVTDISPMLPYLRAGGDFTFRWNSKHQFDPREVPYVLTLRLRLSNQGKAQKPVEIQRLWSDYGGPLDSDYDARHPPISFEVSSGVTKVDLVTLITGHGAETGNCSEFCNNTHHFRVNGKAPHSLTFPEAATQFACRDKVGEGVVPNQYGTWYFGRAGWCPGWDVKPWVRDITADLVPGTNQITYSAMIGNQPPAPGNSYGSIALSSYLVFYR